MKEKIGVQLKLQNPICVTVESKDSEDKGPKEYQIEIVKVEVGEHEAEQENPQQSSDTTNQTVEDICKQMAEKYKEVKKSNVGNIYELLMGWIKDYIKPTEKILKACKMHFQVLNAEPDGTLLSASISLFSVFAGAVVGILTNGIYSIRSGTINVLVLDFFGFLFAIVIISFVLRGMYNISFKKRKSM